MADARRHLDKKYPTHGPFGARNRDRFFVKVEQGLRVRVPPRLAYDELLPWFASRRAKGYTRVSYRRQTSTISTAFVLVVASACFEKKQSFGIL